MISIKCQKGMGILDQYKMLQLMYADCRTSRGLQIGIKFSERYRFKLRRFLLVGGSGGMSPRKFLNLEALKCHFWYFNTTISVKNLRQFDRNFCLQPFQHKSTWFYWVFLAVFQNIRVNYFAFHFPLWEFDENITAWVEIGIFPILIAYWSGFRIFKQNWDNSDKIGMVGHSVCGTLWTCH